MMSIKEKYILGLIAPYFTGERPWSIGSYGGGAAHGQNGAMCVTQAAIENIYAHGVGAAPLDLVDSSDYYFAPGSPARLLTFDDWCDLQELHDCAVTAVTGGSVVGLEMAIAGVHRFGAAYTVARSWLAAWKEYHMYDLGDRVGVAQVAARLGLASFTPPVV